MLNSHLDAKQMLNQSGWSNPYVEQMPRRITTAFNFGADKLMSNYKDMNSHGQLSRFNWEENCNFKALERSYAEAKYKFDECPNSIHAYPHHDDNSNKYKRRSSYFKFTLQNDSHHKIFNRMNTLERQKLVRKYLDETPNTSRQTSHLKLPEFKFRRIFNEKCDLESNLFSLDRRFNLVNTSLIPKKQFLPFPPLTNYFKNYPPLHIIPEESSSLDLPKPKTNFCDTTNFNIQGRNCVGSNNMDKMYQVINERKIPFVDIHHRQYKPVSDVLDQMSTKKCIAEWKIENNGFDVGKFHNNSNKREFVPSQITNPSTKYEFKTRGSFLKNTQYVTVENSSNRTHETQPVTVQNCDRNETQECRTKNSDELKEKIHSKTKIDTKSTKDKNDIRFNKAKTKEKRTQKKFMMNRYLDSVDLTEKNNEEDNGNIKQMECKNNEVRHERTRRNTKRYKEIDENEKNYNNLKNKSKIDTTEPTEQRVVIRNDSKSIFEADNLEIAKQPETNDNFNLGNNEKRLSPEDSFQTTRSEISLKANDNYKQNNGHEIQREKVNIEIPAEDSSKYTLEKSTDSEEFFDCPTLVEENVSRDFSLNEKKGFSCKSKDQETNQDTNHNHVSSCISTRGNVDITMNNISKQNENSAIKRNTHTNIEPTETVFVSTKEKFNKICEQNHAIIKSDVESQVKPISPHSKQDKENLIKNAVLVQFGCIKPDEKDESAVPKTKPMKTTDRVTRSIETQTISNGNMVKNKDLVKIPEKILGNKSLREIGIGTSTKEFGNTSRRKEFSKDKNKKSPQPKPYVPEKYFEKTICDTPSGQMSKDSSEQDCYKIMLVKKVKHGPQKDEKENFISTKSSTHMQKPRYTQKINNLKTNSAYNLDQKIKIRHFDNESHRKSLSDESFAKSSFCKSCGAVNLKQRRRARSCHSVSCEQFLCSSCEGISIRLSSSVHPNASITTDPESSSTLRNRPLKRHDIYDVHEKGNIDRKGYKSKRRSIQRVRKISSKNVKWRRKENKYEMDEIDIALSYSSCSTASCEEVGTYQRLNAKDVRSQDSGEQATYKKFNAKHVKSQNSCHNRSRIWEQCDTQYLQLKGSKKWYHFCFKP